MTIPANQIVNVVPSVISAGGTGPNGVGLMLTTSTRIPLGTVQSFANQQAVAAYFGAGSYHAAEAGIYFTGFNGATIQPSTLLMAQYNQNAVAAYICGGNVSTLTLAQLQAISGSLDIVIDGYARNAASVNLSAATSFSNAATIIASALNTADPTEATVTAAIGATFTGSQSGTSLTTTSVTGLISIGDTVAGTGVASGTTIVSQTSGTTGGAGVYVTSKSGTASSASCTASSNVLDVTVVSGTIEPGQYVTGAGVTSAVILSQAGGTTGGVGTYVIAGSPQQVASESMTIEATPVAVTYDSISGAFVITSGIVGPNSTAAFATGTIAATLLLTSATGAVLSQGAAAATPAALMTALIAVNSNWANFMTLFDPDNGTGNTVKQAFAAWKNTALGGNKFGYFCWDPDESPATSSDAAGSLGRILAGNNDSGTLLIWEGGATGDTGLCAFALGVAASTNFQQTNGRVNYAGRSQSGLVADVSDPVTSQNLLANGYSFYGAYGAANPNFIWLQNGAITGPFQWTDSYEIQIWLNGQFQVALLTLLQNTLSIPFSTAGAALITGACQSVIQAGLNFRAFGPDTLDATEIAEVNNAAGLNIAPTLQSQGYYLQVNVPGATVRASRGPWPITFWYIDQGSVQSIDLSSVLVQ
jgi:hypothetical protein